jgi:hypothetical protein
MAAFVDQAPQSAGFRRAGILRQPLDQSFHTFPFSDWAGGRVHAL